MSKYSFFIITLILPLISSAQPTRDFLNHVPTKKELRLAEKHNQCFHTNKYTAKQRRAFFPFNTADTIKLISFEFPGPEAEITIDSTGRLGSTAPKWDSLPMISAIAPNKFLLNTRRIKEMRVLSIGGIDSLTDIFYNIGFTPVKNLVYFESGFGASCYEPRNAVIFINAKGDITQYFEICFGCRHHYWSSSKVKDVDYCYDKYDLLRKYFLAMGIKFGATSKYFEESVEDE